MHGTTVPLDPGKQQSVARLEALARLMDGAFVLPGTTIRFGLDGIIGLIPVAGDVIAGLVSTYLIWEARQLGAPSWLIARMLANAFLDTTIGAIPVVGDAFDVLFRANMKNMALLRRHLEKKGYAQPVGIDMQQSRSQLFSTEVAEVVDPAADIRIVLIRQIVQGFVAVMMKPPPPDRPTNGLQRLRTGGGHEAVRLDLPSPHRLPGSKRVTKKVERLVEVAPVV